MGRVNPCRCSIDTDLNGIDQRIIYCPLHSAAQEMLEALEFYAKPRHYGGPNQTAEPGERSASPYLVDVTRDGGEIARAAIAKAREVKP